MKRALAAIALAATSFGLPAAPARAQAYPIDCAILLCLAGGWPASVPCARARAVFIRRITPWPVEPPLQIWRCPMNVSLRIPQGQELPYLLRDAVFALGPTPESWPLGVEVREPDPERGPAPAVLRTREEAIDLRKRFLHLAQAVGAGADIDISGAAFDYVRSIEVWHVRYSVRLTGSSQNCTISDQTDYGSYGLQGDFRWSKSAARLSPVWIRPRYDCNHLGSMRAVGVSWIDSSGAPGHELVTY
jgi:hypothetical protein